MLGNDKLVHLIFLLYRNIKTRVQVNGLLSAPIKVERGVRQGCPLSPSLYVIYVHVFLNFLLQQGDIRGLEVPGNTVKVSAYADDLLFFCGDQGEVKRIYDIFDLIYEATGSRINKNKTEILNLSDTRWELGQQVDQLKVYGVVFNRGKWESLAGKNCQLVTKKIENRLEWYARMCLSLHRKVLLLNSSINSLVFHVASVFLPAEKVLKAVARKVYSFIWNNKREPVARECIYITNIIKKRFIWQT